MLNAWRLMGAFFTRDLLTEMSYRLSFVLSFSSVFFTTFSFFFISSMIDGDRAAGVADYGGDYFAFVIIGLAIGNFFTLGLNGFAAALRDAQMTGTLEALLMTPVKLPLVVIGQALWNYVFTAFRVLLYLVLGTLLGMRIENGNWAAALLIFLLTIISSASIGIIAASIIMVIKRGNPITVLFGSLATLVSGVWYSTEILPTWLQWIARFIPLTWALDAMRNALLNSANWATLLPSISVLALFCLILLPLSLWVFRIAVGIARRDGSLAHY